MSGLSLKLQNRAQRKNRIRATVTGTSERPRLSITVSNLHVSAQIIDDSTGTTLVAATSVGNNTKATLTEKAVMIGTDIAAKAKKAKITAVVFDRSGRKYHGRVKALADAAREKGLVF